MRIPALATAAAAFASLSAPAFAQEEAPPPDFTISGGATFVSDYRFRGISQSNRRPAIQGTIAVSHSSGVYASAWGSSVSDYIADNSAEMDFIAGYKKSFGGTTLDVGVLYYYYPDSSFTNSDFAELFASVSHTYGPVTAKVGVMYAPKQQALSADGINKADNVYVTGDLSAGIPDTPITLTAHVGHSFSESYLTFGQEYTDWSLGASLSWKNLSLGVAYVDTDADIFVGSRNISKSGVVASLGVSF